ncbi:precorrin-2 dehydrogenase/sirohydrochlorin ferrochelatase family protein [Maribellus sediminis]|uniref:precorrin-2 dehydrogenase/sirohydrochlorin ferrochelatase family protein n=1 Tax=Maribellus sediminis TaxID=2696285 RepID=UPI001430805D|nr:bifunctional precorrin-2 dehydrogenase/sirohydrochlorin ferrochelatase [Maribellus sediminis]
MNKNFLPISIDIANEKILIIGGGLDALKKIRILQRFDAHVEVLAKDVCDEIKNSGVNYIEAEYDKQFLRDYLMVYSCANNDVLDRQIVKDAKEAGVLVNIHDKPALCQFVSPAIYRHGKITVAVGSNGEDVYESIRIRNLIKEKINFN